MKRLLILGLASVIALMSMSLLSVSTLSFSQDTDSSYQMGMLLFNIVDSWTVTTKNEDHYLQATPNNSCVFVALFFEPEDSSEESILNQVTQEIIPKYIGFEFGEHYSNPINEIDFTMVSGSGKINGIDWMIDITYGIVSDYGNIFVFAAASDSDCFVNAEFQTIRDTFRVAEQD